MTYTSRGEWLTYLVLYTFKQVTPSANRCIYTVHMSHECLCIMYILLCTHAIHKHVYACTNDTFTYHQQGGYVVKMTPRRLMFTIARWMARVTSTGGWCSRLTTCLPSKSWSSRRNSTSTVSPRRRCMCLHVSRCRCGTTTSSARMTSSVRFCMYL